MPQHWVGLFVALVLASGSVRLDTATSAQPPAADLGLPGAIATRFAGNSTWETGTVAIPGDDPQVLVYVAQQVGGSWVTAVEGTPRFRLLAEQGRAALAGTPSEELLASTSTGVTGTRSNGAAKLSLPWAKGKTWRLTGGPHSNNGYRSAAWSSLDFAGPRPGVSAKVRAARGGIVVRPCANLVQIRHGNGWKSSYYHLKKITVRAGQRVARGALLGYTSTAAGCGGWASGPHVHFSVMRNGSYVNIEGHAIGGWVVRDSKSMYAGCMVRGDKRRCAPNGSIHNDGTVGSN